MAYPQISYDDKILLFTYPDVNKPGADARIVDREDTLSQNLVQQSMYYSTDIVKTLQMDFVPMADLPDWEAFFEWAEQGKPFAYFPDSALTDNTTYLLVDKNWQPMKAFPGMAKFTIKMREQVEG
jgi:hypothetical protein